jgi:hypothetical protein
MGLNISVGMLADLIENDEAGANWLSATLRGVNEVLAEHDRPTYEEPEQVPPLISRAQSLNYSYSFLHYLRRFYANVIHNPKWIPTVTSDGESATDDPVLAEEMYMMSSHLLCHSDSDGFYLPIDFDDIMIDDTGADRIPGGILGSSYKLMRELIEIAPSLGIKLRGGNLSDDEATRINTIADSEQGFWIEHLVWISLFEAARLSIEHGSAIVFA